MERLCKEQKQIKQYQPGKPSHRVLPNIQVQIPVLLLFAFLLLPITINAGFVNLKSGYNLFSLPVEPFTNINCTELKTRLGANSVSRLDIQTQLFENCKQNEIGFPIEPSISYVLETPSTGAFNFEGVNSCPKYNLAKGMNLIGCAYASGKHELF